MESAIGRLRDLDQLLSFEVVEALVQSGQKLAAPTSVQVGEVVLSAYDQLLNLGSSQLAVGAVQAVQEVREVNHE